MDPITCAKCGHDNDAASKYCTNCGTRLGPRTHIICPACYYRNPLHRASCENCGSTLVRRVDTSGPDADSTSDSSENATDLAFGTGQLDSKDVIPSWLQEFDSSKTGALVETWLSDDDADQTEWLQRLKETGPLTPLADDLEEIAAESDADTTLDWLASPSIAPPSEPPPPPESPDTTEDWFASIAASDPADDDNEDFSWLTGGSTPSTSQDPLSDIDDNAPNTGFTSWLDSHANQLQDTSPNPPQSDTQPENDQEVPAFTDWLGGQTEESDTLEPLKKEVDTLPEWLEESSNEDDTPSGFTDWLNKQENTPNSAPQSPVNSQPLDTAETDKIPDWLEPPAPDSPENVAGGFTNWLDKMTDGEESSPILDEPSWLESSPSAAQSAGPEPELSDWLASVEAGAEEALSPTDSNEWHQDASTSSAATQLEDIPDWLQDTEKGSVSDNSPTPSSGLTNWLKEDESINTNLLHDREDVSEPQIDSAATGFTGWLNSGVIDEEGFGSDELEEDLQSSRTGFTGWLTGDPDSDPAPSVSDSDAPWANEGLFDNQFEADDGDFADLEGESASTGFTDWLTKEGLEPEDPPPAFGSSEDDEFDSNLPLPTQFQPIDKSELLDLEDDDWLNELVDEEAVDQAVEEDFPEWLEKDDVQPVDEPRTDDLPDWLRRPQTDALDPATLGVMEPDLQPPSTDDSSDPFDFDLTLTDEPLLSNDEADLNDDWLDAIDSNAPITLSKLSMTDSLGDFSDVEATQAPHDDEDDDWLKEITQLKPQTGGDDWMGGISDSSEGLDWLSASEGAGDLSDFGSLSTTPATDDSGRGDGLGDSGDLSTTLDHDSNGESGDWLSVLGEAREQDEPRILIESVDALDHPLSETDGLNQEGSQESAAVESDEIADLLASSALLDIGRTPPATTLDDIAGSIDQSGLEDVSHYDDDVVQEDEDDLYDSLSLTDLLQQSGTGGDAASLETGSLPDWVTGGAIEELDSLIPEQAQQKQVGGPLNGFVNVIPIAPVIAKPPPEQAPIITTFQNGSDEIEASLVKTVEELAARQYPDILAVAPPAPKVKRKRRRKRNSAESNASWIRVFYLMLLFLMFFIFLWLFQPQLFAPIDLNLPFDLPFLPF